MGLRRCLNCLHSLPSETTPASDGEFYCTEVECIWARRHNEARHKRVEEMTANYPEQNRCSSCGDETNSSGKNKLGKPFCKKAECRRHYQRLYARLFR